MLLLQHVHDALFTTHVCSCCFSNMSMMLFSALRPLESRLRDECAGTPCAIANPSFLPMLHNLLRPEDFYCIRCPLNFDAGNLCRKQPRPGGLGLQKPIRRHKETAYLSLADCIIACLDVWRRGRGTKFRGAASPALMPPDYETRSTKKALPVWTFLRLPLGVQHKK